MSWIRRIINRIIPEDNSIQCGYGPISLPLDHPFTRACQLHDWEFEQAHEGSLEKTIHQVDWDLFYRWVLIAKAEQNPERRCELAKDICYYWVLARWGGNVLWDGRFRIKVLGRLKRAYKKA